MLDFPVSFIPDKRRIKQNENSPTSRARFQGQNFMVKILHLTKSSTQISNILLFFWYDLPFAR